MLYTAGLHNVKIMNGNNEDSFCSLLSFFISFFWGNSSFDMLPTNVLLPSITRSNNNKKGYNFAIQYIKSKTPRTTKE